MKRMRNLSLCVVILLQILFVSCSENPVSSDANTGTVKISIKGANLNGAASANKAVLNKAAMVTLTSAKVVIEKIEFENSVDASLDFKFDQPFVEDLVTITNLQEIETVQIPFGSYDQIKVAIDDLDAEDGDVFTQNPDLQNLSILVKGFLNDSNDSFEFSSDLTVNLNLKFDPPLEINQQTLSTNITLNIIFDQWFVDANGDFIDPNLPGNRSQIEENIKKSFEVFEDRNKDGEPDDDDDDEVEVKGAIESLGADSLVVSGTTFFVDGNTEVLDNNRNPISFSDLKVGDVVEVRALRQADGSLLATRIELEDENRQGEEVKVKGAIESLGADSLVVSGTTFFVDGNTEVKAKGKGTISFSDLKVGDVVEVRALRQADGSLLATRIELEDENRQGEEVEVKGAIESLGADSLVVSGTTFFVDGNTRIGDEDERSISLSDLKVGDFVEVKAVRQADGRLLATRIEVEDENREEEGEKLEVKGAIESLGADSLVVSGTTFFVDGNTRIRDEDERSISLSDLKVGDFVEVKAILRVDGTWLATRIDIEDEHKRGGDDD